MYELKKMERYLRINLLGPRPRHVKKEPTGPRSHKGWEILLYVTQSRCLLSQQTCDATRNEHFFCSWEQLC